MTYLTNLTEMLDRQAEQRAQTIAAFNYYVKPLLETTDSDNLTWGVFKFEDGWYWGQKYKNGYHPESLQGVPKFVVETLLAPYRVLMQGTVAGGGNWSSDDLAHFEFEAWGPRAC